MIVYLQPQANSQVDEDDEPKQKTTHRVTDFQNPQLKGIVAQRMAAMYEQKAVSLPAYF